MGEERLTILYIDDDPDDHLIFGDSITSLHPSANVIIAHDGEQALSLLTFFEENDHPVPNLIILDMNMPRMNGKQVIAAIRNRSNGADVPVVIFTTHSSETDIEFFRSFGCECITKPISYATLMQTMKQVLSHSRPYR